MIEEITPNFYERFAQLGEYEQQAATELGSLLCQHSWLMLEEISVSGEEAEFVLDEYNILRKIVPAYLTDKDLAIAAEEVDKAFR